MSMSAPTEAGLRLQLASDLHLERYPDFVLEADPQADVLVLAGDIGSYQRGSALAARGVPGAQLRPVGRPAGGF